MKNARLAGILAMGLFAVPVVTAQQTQQQGGPAANEAVRTLSKGTTIKVKTQGQLSSQTNKVGDIVPGVVSDDVKDASGAVIFPSGAAAQMAVVETGNGLGLVIASVKSAAGSDFHLKSATNSQYTGNPPSGANAGASAGVSAGGGGISAGGNMGGQRDTAAAGVSGGISAGGNQAGVSGNAGVTGRTDSSGVTGRVGVSGQPGAQAQAGAGVQNQGAGQANQGHSTWNVFKKNSKGFGTVSSQVKEPPVGADFVVPPGTTINFDFGDEAVMVVS